MKKELFTAVVFMFAMIVVSTPLIAVPPVVTHTGMKLVDRQCSVEDAYQLQASTERYCTLTYREADGTRTWTVYCPNAAVDGQPLNTAYTTCSDPDKLQILHPTKNYTVTGWLRTVAQQADGKGQVQGYQFSY